MPRPKCTVAWLLLIPAFAAVQTTETPPARHDTVEVRANAPTAPAATSPAQTVKPDEVKELPSRPATVNDVLPLLPGITRTPDGGLRMNGGGEQRGAMLVNQAYVTDPATGSFGAGVPVDSIQEISVYATPFLAQYGRFSSGVVAVETKRGSDKWHFEINDPFPDFRFRSWQLRGLQDASPRLVVGGPLVKNRIYFAQTVLFDFRKIPNRTLPFPDNTSKQQRFNSFTQFDFILSAKQYITGSGQTRYRAAEVTARFGWRYGQWFLAYTRSRSQGDLNDFSGFLGNYPLPLIRPNVFSNTSADLPNRFLAWGTVKLPWRMQILPIIEYRNGLAYAQYDVLGNYVGVPNSTRFPNFSSADARVFKDIKVSPKYTVRLSLTGHNLTNHSTPWPCMPTSPIRRLGYSSEIIHGDSGPIST